MSALERLALEARARDAAWDGARQARVLDAIGRVESTRRRRWRAANVVVSSLAVCAIVALCVRALGATPSPGAQERGPSALAAAPAQLAWDDAGPREAASD